jgi:hypothetical protein
VVGRYLADTPPDVRGPGEAATYGSGVGTTGVIFAAIAIAWLAYLVPHFVRRREDELVGDEVDPADQFADSVQIVRHGTAPLLNQDLTPIAAYEVSTPLTRRAAVRDLRRLEQVAAGRRRRVFLVLLALVSATVVACAGGLTPWWLLAVPGGLLLTFVVVARISVQAMRRDLDARYRDIRRGGDESTVLLSRKELAQAAPSAAPAKVTTSTGALWDPVPITMPTYVSKPLAPRTVRTIDLSGPGVGASSRPVTADAPVTATAVGETRYEADGDGAQAVSA